MLLKVNVPLLFYLRQCVLIQSVRGEGDLYTK